MLRVLEDKGHLKHRQTGPRYIYEATMPRNKARQSALQRVVRTFFDGSTEEAVAALLDMSAPDLSAEELARLRALIDQAKEEGR
jgi:predicted transcriptional regulator